MTLKEAAHVVYEQYMRNDKNIQGIGITDDSIIVYTKKKTKGYPKEVEGWPVVVKRVGKIMPGVIG